MHHSLLCSRRADQPRNRQQKNKNACSTQQSALPRTRTRPHLHAHNTRHPSPNSSVALISFFPSWPVCSDISPVNNRGEFENSRNTFRRFHALSFISSSSRFS